MVAPEFDKACHVVLKYRRVTRSLIQGGPGNTTHPCIIACGLHFGLKSRKSIAAGLLLFQGAYCPDLNRAHHIVCATTIFFTLLGPLNE